MIRGVNSSESVDSPEDDRRQYADKQEGQNLRERLEDEPLNADEEQHHERGPCPPSQKRPER